MSKNMISVLLVEDTRAMHTALQDLLRTIGGFRVLGAAVGESEATEWLQAHRRTWDLAIVDLMLTNGSGFGVVRRMHHEHPAGRIVVYSDFVTPVLREKCISLGADDAFAKTDLQGLVGYLDRFHPVDSVH
jgi:DNA-binding NarL/FixJ family response regulator